MLASCCAWLVLACCARLEGLSCHCARLEPPLCSGCARLELPLCSGCARLEPPLCSGCARLDLILTWLLLDGVVNCLDRHAEANPDKTALIWEKDEPGKEERISYT